MSRYAAAHANPNGAGDSRPTGLQIIKDEGMEGKLNGKCIVITGASSGIGIETVRALAATGATLFVTARSPSKAKTALASVLDTTRVEIIEMDLESFASVRAAANAILEKTSVVNILINNAGIMAVPALEFTKDGHELQFGTNHLSHFLLFHLLKPALLAAASHEFPSRVVIVASSGHRIHGLNESDNYNFQKGNYDAMIAYGQSKTANILMANEIERRYGSQGLHATSLHPGLIDTPLSKFLPPGAMSAMQSEDAFRKTMKSLEQGCATTIWAAIGKQWADNGGKYLDNCAEALPAASDSDQLAPVYASYIYDEESEGRLWNDSLRLVGLNA